MTERAAQRPVARMRAALSTPSRLRLSAARRVLLDPFVGQAVYLALPLLILAPVADVEAWLVATTIAAFIAAQIAASVSTRHAQARRDTRWNLARFGMNVALVASGQLLLGVSGLLAIGYLPIIALAAAHGRRQAIVAFGAAAVSQTGVELVTRMPEGDAIPRAAIFCLIAGLTATTTRLEVGRHERARRRLREAVTIDRRRARQIAGVEAIGRILAKHGPTPQALDAVVARISSELGYRYVSIYLGTARRVHLGAQRGYANLVPAFDGSRGIVGRVMNGRAPVLVADVTKDPDYWSLNSDVRSEICVPLVADDEFHGLINVESTLPNPLDTTDMRAMIAVADRLAAALTIGRDRQQLAERADLFRALHGFSEAINGTLQPTELYQAIVSSVPAVVAADIAALTVLERSTGRYYLRAIHGTTQAADGIEVRIGEGMAGRAIRDRTLIIDEQFGQSSYPKAVAHLRPPDAAPMQAAAIPLVRDGAVVGALSVMRTDASRQFSDLDRDALSMLGEQAALAVANAFLHGDVHDLAIRDPLTGLFNRRYLDPALEQLIAQRERQPEEERPNIALVMFDLDHFSELNNAHGHLAGDAVLRSFGALLASRMRSTDLVARFGGEEFAAVLFRASLDDAVGIAEEIRGGTARMVVEAPGGAELRVTVSAGCAAAGPDTATAESLLRAADLALYMAKRAGRDRVVAA